MVKGDVVYISGLLLVVGLGLLLVVVKARQPFEKKPETKVRGDELAIWPFEPMLIMTDTEVLFFNKLQQAIPECYIFCQVQLSRIIEPNDDAGEDRSFWLNRICRQSIDYVLVDGNAQTTLLAIELDDWTHQSQSSQKADAKKDKALASAGIPVLRFHAERMPSVEILRHDIVQVLEAYAPYLQ